MLAENPLGSVTLLPSIAVSDIYMRRKKMRIFWCTFKA